MIRENRVKFRVRLKTSNRALQSLLSTTTTLLLLSLLLFFIFRSFRVDRVAVFQVQRTSEKKKKNFVGDKRKTDGKSSTLSTLFLYLKWFVFVLFSAPASSV